ncbi:MAG: TIGR00730 family Rossman fold protein [Candidatus Omnitrophica bacterium]|nr:TIGR00730 family Rossman fold protein [Candidatus Omnitrophota bacterium]
MPAGKKKLNTGFIKAYNNYEFLNSPAARTIRILTEMIEPRERLRQKHIHNTVVFFGSARTLPRADARRNFREAEKQFKAAARPTASLKKKLVAAEGDLVMSRFYEDAVELAEKLTIWFKDPTFKRRRFLVCTGGGPGIMEAANRGAKKAKGESIGLNISLPLEQNPNPYQTKDISCEFHYFFIRKFWFFYLAKAMIVFPGGFGTLDELFELLTLVQTEKTRKYMPIVLYGKDYWNEVVNFQALVHWGMISQEDLKLFKICDDVDSAFAYLQAEIQKHHLR